MELYLTGVFVAFILVLIDFVELNRENRVDELDTLVQLLNNPVELGYVSLISLGSWLTVILVIICTIT